MSDGEALQPLQTHKEGAHTKFEASDGGTIDAVDKEACDFTAY